MKSSNNSHPELIDSDLLDWLLEGDVSIQYQTYRDLLDQERPDLKSRISSEGWGKEFLSRRGPNGHWGVRFYEPKWISTHYTLLDLRNLCISQDHAEIQDAVNLVADHEKSNDGGVDPHAKKSGSDVCVNGMFLHYACYFKIEEAKLESVIDFLLDQWMPDGGFNCMSNRSGAVHSSLHTTLSVLEGITTYKQNGYGYRIRELDRAENASREFVLIHQLFKSDHTGEVIRKDFLKFPYPPRWRYDILRAMDHFQEAKMAWDERMRPAVDMIFKKRNKNKAWNVYAKYPGKVHFEMEKVGARSRWNTLRALRTFKYYNLAI